MRLGTKIPTFGDPQASRRGNFVPQKIPKIFKKRGQKKEQNSPGQERLRQEEKMMEKRGKLGLKWCSVRFWLLEREGKKKVEKWDFPADLGFSRGFGIFPWIWDFSRGFGNLRDEANPKKEREGISRGVSVCE